jgi:coiled-coil domain-containing protein 63/114
MNASSKEKNNADLFKDQSNKKKLSMTKQIKSQIALLSDFEEKYSSKILQEQKLLNEKIEEVENKIKEQREKLKNAPNERQTSDKVSKQIKSLENQLDKNFKEYNQAVAHNCQLRDKIDALRRERIVFDKIYKKLEKELESKKKEMQHIITEAEEAYNAREQAKVNMETLKKEAEKEQFEFQLEWAKLEKIIEKDKQANSQVFQNKE